VHFPFADIRDGARRSEWAQCMGALVSAMCMRGRVVADGIPAAAPIAKLSQKCRAPVLMLPKVADLDMDEFAYWADISNKAWQESARHATSLPANPVMALCLFSL
jgi:hypothetical protein